MLLSNHTLEAMTSSDGFRRKALASLGAILGMAVSVGHQALGVTAVSARRSSSSSSSSSSGGRAPQGKIRAAWAGSSRADAAFPLLHLHFCLSCSDPASEGSLGKKNSLHGYFDAPRTHVWACVRPSPYRPLYRESTHIEARYLQHWSMGDIGIPLGVWYSK